MKALQVVEPGEFELVHIPLPQLSSEDNDTLLVKTEWAALCGSDIAFFAGIQTL